MSNFEERLVAVVQRHGDRFTAVAAKVLIGVFVLMSLGQGLRAIINNI